MAMQSLLERRLLIVTGKGGVGKTTIAGAIGLLAARRGSRTIVIDFSGASTRLHELFAAASKPDGVRDKTPSSTASKPDGAKDRTPSSVASEPDGVTSPMRPSAAASEPDGVTGRAGPSATASEPGGVRDRTPPSAAAGDARRRPWQLAENLWSASIDSDQALLEWMQELGGRVPARLLASKASFQYFAAAAPGAKELVCMMKACGLAGSKSAEGYDLVVLDAPATGHALAMLAAPRTFASIARVGPIAVQAQRVQAMLEDRALTGYLAVAQASEMAVSETLDLQQELAGQLGVELAAVIVNATMHRRFTGEELERIASLRGEEQATPRSRLAHAAAAAAHAAHARTRFQHSQLARLRRHGLEVLQVPFVFQSELDLDALRRIADRLEGRL